MAGYMEELYQPLVVTGTAGNDSLYGGKGADRIDGGEGEDTYVVGFNFGQSAPIGRNGAGVTVGVSPHADTLVNVEWLAYADLLVRLDDPIFLQAVQHSYTTGADTLIGNDWGYSLSGDGGDDVLIGNGGDDTLYGGKGNDTAVYRGNRADYLIEYDVANQRVVVHDQLAGRDGKDYLLGIETLRFADMELAVGPLPAPPAPAAPAYSANDVIGLADGLGGIVPLVPMGSTMSNGTTGYASAHGSTASLELMSLDASSVLVLAAPQAQLNDIQIELIGVYSTWQTRGGSAYISHCEC